MNEPTSWPDVIGRFRLGWRLLRDPLVPGWAKLVPLGVVCYILLPIDIVPDMFLGLGQLDDLGVLLLGLRVFIAVCPRALVLKHLSAMGSVEGTARQVDESMLGIPAAVSGDDEGKQTVDGQLAGPSRKSSEG